MWDLVTSEESITIATNKIWRLKFFTKFGSVFFQDLLSLVSRHDSIIQDLKSHR